MLLRLYKIFVNMIGDTMDMVTIATSIAAENAVALRKINENPIHSRLTY
jgi:hypothetical protein